MDWMPLCRSPAELTSNSPLRSRAAGLLRFYRVPVAQVCQHAEFVSRSVAARVLATTSGAIEQLANEEPAQETPTLSAIM
jgi:hypothetical protein